MALSEEEFGKLTDKEKGKYLKLSRGIAGKGDLVYLAREILGYSEVDRGVHGELIRVLGDKSPRKLILMPRGSFKSSIVRSWAIQRMLNNPNIRILWDSEVRDNSITNVSKIKEHMRSGEFTGIYGRLIDTTKRETATEFTIRTRKDITKKEATMVAAGIGTVNVGPHYDLIICDDLHSEKNVSTKEQIEKVIAHYRLLLSLLDPGGELVIIGTRWHFADLYNFLIEEEGVEEKDNWEVYIESAIREDGSLFFPSRLSREFLDEQRKAQGAYLFSVLYLNQPQSGETQVFRKEDFRYFDGDYPTLDDKRVLLNIYIMVDRAFSTKDSADYTGIVVAGVSSSNNIYILEAERKKCGLEELSDTIFSLRDKYGQRVMGIGIETINFEEVQKFFSDQMKKRNKFFILTRLVPTQGMSKTGRIESALAARYANHCVYHKRRLVDYEDELLRFPVGAHDDLIDAASYVVTMMLAPSDPSLETDNLEYLPSGMFGNTGY